MNIPVIVSGQRMIFPEGSYRFAPRSQKFVCFAFELSSDWNGLTVFVQFAQGNTAYNSYLDSNNCAYLPSELTVGQCLMTLYGTSNDQVIGTTLPIKLCIADNGYVEDASSTGITRTLYMQLLEAMQDQYDSFTADVQTSIDDMQEQYGDFTTDVQTRLDNMDTRLDSVIYWSDVATLAEVKRALGI